MVKFCLYFKNKKLNYHSIVNLGQKKELQQLEIKKFSNVSDEAEMLDFLQNSNCLYHQISYWFF